MLEADLGLLQEAIAPAAEVPQLREDKAGFPAARAGRGRWQGRHTARGHPGQWRQHGGLAGRAGGAYEERKAKMVKDTMGAPGQRKDNARAGH